MKKSIVTCILGLGFLIGMNSAQASCESYVCPQNFELTSSTSRFFSHVTGQNFLAEKIGESAIKKAIKKDTQGDFKVKLGSYSARDLKSGKFKSLEISGKDIIVDGVYISKADIKTLCDYNYIVQQKNGDVTVMEDVPIGISIEMSEADLNKTMMSKDYKRLLNDLNTIGGAFNIFTIDSTYIKIKNNKIYYVMKIAIPFIRGTQEVVIAADLRVKNGEITFANAELVNNHHSNTDLSKISSMLNYINPLDFSVKILENKNANLSIQNVSLEDGKILMDAHMLVLKDVK